jgi:glycosyltransferase involved in cell wall biosynthesis
MRFVEPENPQVLAEAMLWLAQHPQEAVQMGQRAQARVHQYAWEELMARWLPG